MQVMTPTSLCKIRIVTTLLSLDQPYNISAHKLLASHLSYHIKFFFKVKIHHGINEKMPKGYKVSIQSITTLLST